MEPSAWTGWSRGGSAGAGADRTSSRSPVRQGTGEFLRQRADRIAAANEDALAAFIRGESIAYIGMILILTAFFLNIGLKWMGSL